MRESELEPGEQIVREARPHWLLLFGGFLPYAILLALPFALPNLVTLFPSDRLAAFLNYHDPLGRAALGVWLLLVWTAAWSVFTRYFLNAWVLTNKRIITIKQRAFFRREVSSLFLSRVQDVTTDVSGVVSSLLGIGDIKVQSAGADVEFHMRGIGRPEQMRDLILRYSSSMPGADE